jgi:hypothetical protein
MYLKMRIGSTVYEKTTDGYYSKKLPGIMQRLKPHCPNAML